MNSQFATGYDLNDLLFQNRNRAYGAFPLRKQYNQRLIYSMVLVFGFVSVWACWVLYKDVSSTVQFVKAPYQTVLYQLKNPVLPTPKPTPPVSKSKAGSATKAVSGKIVITSQPLPPVRLTFSGGGDDRPFEGGNGTTVTGTGSDSTQVGITTTSTIANNQAPVVDVAPSFPGGVGALRQFLERNLVNPRDLESGEEVAVMVYFIVGYDGGLKDIRIDDEVESIFIKEIRRVFARMPNWEPGKSSGKKVTVQYQMPIKFVAVP